MIEAIAALFDVWWPIVLIGAVALAGAAIGVRWDDVD